MYDFNDSGHSSVGLRICRRNRVTLVRYASALENAEVALYQHIWGHTEFNVKAGC
jgi:hypothetical protein